MEINIAKDKKPNVKLKREAEVVVRKKELIKPKKRKDPHFEKEKRDFQIKRRKDSDMDKDTKKSKVGESKPYKKETDIYTDRRRIDKRKKRERDFDKSFATSNDWNSVSTKPASDIDILPESSLIHYNPSINVQEQAKQQFIQAKQIEKAKTPNIRIKDKQSDTMLKGVKKGGSAVLTQLEGGEDINEALHLLGLVKGSVDTISEKSQYTSERRKMKVRKPDNNVHPKQVKEGWRVRKKELQKKQYKKAIQQRKMQYVINKLTGSGEKDNLGQVTKDIIKMKGSMILAQIGKYILGLLAPLAGMLLLTAFPVVLIVFLFYASPLGAFMPNPSVDTPSIQEVLSGYYQEFNAELSAHVGVSGKITYLHMKDGNYVSNYMDTMMVYMVQYGTGDLGVVMDEEHQEYLKKVFDEMNSYDDTTVTKTMKAGESLGDVVTSAYCPCEVCCGQWAGGSTASGVMPTPDHTIAVDAVNPFLPMGTKVIMNGIEYVVEDTGNFAHMGVTFDIYFDDHETALAWGHRTVEAYLADGTENDVTVTHKGGYVKNLDYEDYIKLGKLTKAQEELLREVMSDGFFAEIPSFGVGSDVANMALSKVGCQYDQNRRYEEGYYDCSSLVQRLYAEFGITLPSIASTQGKYIVDNGLEVTEDTLQPGDLIFYSYTQNGEYRNISHVAIYIGNGRMVHAANKSRGVVNDPFQASNINLYGRPSLGK